MPLSNSKSAGTISQTVGVIWRWFFGAWIPDARSWVSGSMLVLSNIVVLAGVLWLQASLSTILFVYWAESIIIGFYALTKMGIVTAHRPNEQFFPAAASFAAAYGVFIFGNFLLLSSFVPEVAEIKLQLSLSQYSIFGIVISHGISLGINFLGKHEYVGKTNKSIADMTVWRLWFLYIGIVVGILPSLFFGPIGSLIGIVCVKTLVDLWCHWSEQKKTEEQNIGVKN